MSAAVLACVNTLRLPFYLLPSPLKNFPANMDGPTRKIQPPLLLRDTPAAIPSE